MDLFEPGTDQKPENYLQELVGEGKKFKDAETLARSKYEADLYIKTLEQQKDQLRTDYLKLREEYNFRADIDDVLDQIKRPVEQVDKPLEPQKPNIDKKQIEDLITSKVQEIETMKKQSENLNSVKEKFKTYFGNNYSKLVEAELEDLGLTTEYITDLAKRSPKAVFKALGIDAPQKDSHQSPLVSTQRNTTFGGKTPKRDWAYYEEIKKADPKKYWTPAVQAQIHKDAMALGNDFGL